MSNPVDPWDVEHIPRADVTEPLPVAEPPEPFRVARPRPAGRLVRVAETVAGLLSAGLVVLGVVLVILQLLARDVAPGTGLAAAAGPTWGRALAQLLVGIAGEAAIAARRWAGPLVRGLLAVAVIVASLVVLWLCWLV